MTDGKSDMEIRLQNIGKRYGTNWVFRNIDLSFVQGRSYAITGDNGSGKSTLLKIISGGLTPSIGHVLYTINGHALFWSDAALKISYAAPYTDLIEHLTLTEHVQFHFRYKKVKGFKNTNDLVADLNLRPHAHKQIKDFSSGMKQRLKLALALHSDDPVLLLDEPTTNLDEHWIKWYLHNVKLAAETRMVIIASNSETEYSFVNEVITVGDSC